MGFEHFSFVFVCLCLTIHCQRDALLLLRWMNCCLLSGFQIKEMFLHQAFRWKMSLFRLSGERHILVSLSDKRNVVPHQAFRWKKLCPSSGFQVKRNVLPLSGSPCLLCVASLCGLPNLWTLAQGEMVVQSDITCSQRCHVKHSWTWWGPFGAGCWTCEHLRRGDSGASHAQTCSRAELSWARLTSVLGWPSVNASFHAQSERSSPTRSGSWYHNAKSECQMSVLEMMVSLQRWVWFLSVVLFLEGLLVCLNVHVVKHLLFVCCFQDSDV